MLEVSDLALVRPGLQLGPVSFALSEPGCWWLLGASGAGKSLLLESIAGFRSHATGSIRVDGREVGGAAPDRRSIALMPQRWQLFPHWSAMRNLRFAAKLSGSPPERIHVLAERLQVQHLLARSPRELSGGESQRMVLIQTLLSSSRVLLLDEPLTAIDASLQASSLSLLKEEAERQGRICLIAAHRPPTDFPLLGGLAMQNCQLLTAAAAAGELH